MCYLGLQVLPMYVTRVVVLGVKQQSVDCADCQVRISGFRYMCQVCFAYDLCIACYMGDKHDSEHPFLRYDNEYSDG